METEVKFQAGEVYELKAVRESEIGLFLDAQTGNTNDDILLHKAQQTAPVKIGDTITVYLYIDPRKRLTASMKLPKVKLGQVARVEVINKSKDGAFVDIGAERGVFLPFSQMYGRVEVGQKIWIKLYRDKTGRQAVTMKVEEDLKRLAKPVPETVKKGDMLVGSIYNMLDDGYLLFTPEHYIAYLHKDETNGQILTYGQELQARITFIREDGRVNISLKALKQVAMTDDAEKIMDLLISRKGSMPYSDATDAEIIKEKFGISKSAFKRALGKLLKEGKIKQEDGWTLLQ